MRNTYQPRGRCLLSRPITLSLIFLRQNLTEPVAGGCGGSLQVPRIILCGPHSGAVITDMHNHTQISLWGVDIETQVLALGQQALLTAEPSLLSL